MLVRVAHGWAALVSFALVLPHRKPSVRLEDAKIQQGMRDVHGDELQGVWEDAALVTRCLDHEPDGRVPDIQLSEPVPVEVQGALGDHGDSFPGCVLDLEHIRGAFSNTLHDASQAS